MKIFFALLAFATSALVASAQPGRPPLLSPGTTAPEFTALKVDDTPVKLSDFRGQVVLIDFWAPWCGPCKKVMPHMEQLHQKLGDQGLVVLGVCVWEERKNFNAWAKKPEVPTSYLKVFDPAGRSRGDIARKHYAVSGIPTFYLVDREGKIAYSGGGAGPQTEAALDNALKKLGFKL